MTKYLLFILIMLFSKLMLAQCNIKNEVFQTGESATYNVYYKIGFVWFNAAEVKFEANYKKYKNKPSYHLVSVGNTLPNYDWIYKVRDTYQSIVDTNTLTPYWFKRNTSEGGRRVNNSYTFEDSLIYSSIIKDDDPEIKDTLQSKQCTSDVLSAIYACRNINFKELEINDTVPLNMVLDNEIYSLYIRYLGTDSTQIRNEKIYDCLKFSILLVEGSIFKGGEDMTVWVTNDKVRVPVRVEAKILIGAIIAELNTVEGIKYPMGLKD